jgi:predicted PurR-regulated permease PerM
MQEISINTLKQRWNTRTIALATLIVMLIIAGFWLLWGARAVVVTVFLSLLLATALNPAVRWLVTRGMARSLATILVMLTAVTVIGVALYLAIPPLINQIQLLSAQLPELYSNVRTALIESPYQVLRRFGRGMPLVAPPAPPVEESVLGQAIALLPILGDFLFGAISAALFTYYWINYREVSIKGVLLLLPMERRSDAEQVWLQIEEKIGGYLRGQLALAVSIGALSALAYWIVGVPYALLLGLAAGVLEVIPFIGAIIAVAAAGIAGASVDPWLGVAAIVAGTIVQQIEGNLLVPRIMDRAVGIGPVVTLLAIAGAAGIFGLGGVLLAVPLAAVLQVLFTTWLEQRDRVRIMSEIEGRGMVDRLRYEVQDLAQDLRRFVRNHQGEGDATIEDAAELEALIGELDTIVMEQA